MRAQGVSVDRHAEGCIKTRRRLDGKDLASNCRVSDEIQGRLDRIATQAEQSSLIELRKGDESCWTNSPIHENLDVTPRCLIEDESESQ